jgi:hypothetical protein
MESELAFRLISPDGREARLYSDGRAEGFPHGTIIVNRVTHLLRVARSQQNPPGPALSNPVDEIEVTPEMAASSSDLRKQ